MVLITLAKIPKEAEHLLITTQLINSTEKPCHTYQMGEHLVYVYEQGKTNFYHVVVLAENCAAAWYSQLPF